MYELITEEGISRDAILNKVSEYEIFKYYLGRNIIINSITRSPFHNDSNPSFGIYRSRKGNLMFKDLSLGYTGDCFTFVKLLLHKQSYKQTLIQVASDLLSNNKCNNYKSKNPPEKLRSKFTHLDIEFDSFDYKYWNSLNINKDILNHFNVYKTQYIIKDGIPIKYSTQGNPIYVYKIYNKVKFYMPYETKRKKHLSALGIYDWGGYEQLPKRGDLVIIAKSMKDVMYLYSIGYNAVTPPSESSNLPDTIISDLKARFKRVIILYDNDEPGKLSARKWALKCDLEYVFIPNSYEEKDPTDFHLKYGLEKTKNLLKELI